MWQWCSITVVEVDGRFVQYRPHHTYRRCCTLGLQSRIVLDGHRNLELFLGSRPTLLMLCLNSILLMQLEGHLEVCYEGDQARFHTWPSGPRLLFDHMPYLLLGVTITPKS